MRLGCPGFLPVLCGGRLSRVYAGRGALFPRSCVGWKNRHEQENGSTASLLPCAPGTESFRVAITVQKALQFLELILTGAGLLVVAAVFAIFRSVEPWKAAAITALFVGVLHGIVFFAVRSAQRKARNDSVRVIRHVFDDLIRNKLQVVLFATEIQGEDWRPVAQKAVLEIQKNLSQIETEALSFPGSRRAENS